jgi:hypothetical protein
MFVLLSSKSNKREWNFDAKHCFASMYSVLYERQYMVYNLHSLIHLADDALLHGNLDSVSAFEFENFMLQIKKILRSKCLPLEQFKNGAMTKSKMGLLLQIILRFR